MSQDELRSKRLAAGLSLDLLSQRSNIDHCTLSLGERLLIPLSPDKVKLIHESIDDLSEKRKLVVAFAAEVGLPTISLRF
jgi:transcriptional regulator with XRE-family HTH domain